MFVDNQAFDSQELLKVYFIYKGSRYDYEQKDAFKHPQPKPWTIIEGPFESRAEAIVRQNALWLAEKEKSGEMEKERSNLLKKYYTEHDSTVKYLRVCHDCKVAYWHVINHCPFCPKKMIEIKGLASELRKIIGEYKLGY